MPGVKLALGAQAEARKTLTPGLLDPQAAPSLTLLQLSPGPMLVCPLHTSHRRGMHWHVAFYVALLAHSRESLFKGPRSHKTGFSPDSKHCQPVIQGIENSPKNTTCDQEGATCKGHGRMVEAAQAAEGMEGTGEGGLKTPVLRHRTLMDRQRGLFLKGFAFLSG